MCNNILQKLIFCVLFLLNLIANYLKIIDIQKLNIFV
jgi:hypothetical protein